MRKTSCFKNCNNHSSRKIKNPTKKKPLNPKRFLFYTLYLFPYFLTYSFPMISLAMT